MPTKTVLLLLLAAGVASAADSPLVALAKRTNRKASKTPVITNETVARSQGRVSIAAGESLAASAPLETPTTATQAEAPASPASPMSPMSPMSPTTIAAQPAQRTAAAAPAYPPTSARNIDVTAARSIEPSAAGNIAPQTSNQPIPPASTARNIEPSAARPPG